MSGLLYLDSSAIAKLVLEEPESQALRAELPQWDHLLSSVLAGIELRRAIARTPDPGGQRLAAAEYILSGVTLVPITDHIAASAGSVGPPTLRTLDAIHLATILVLGRAGVHVAVYDTRLAEAVSANGFTVIAPA